MSATGWLCDPGQVPPLWVCSSSCKTKAPLCVAPEGSFRSNVYQHLPGDPCLYCVSLASCSMWVVHLGGQAGQRLHSDSDPPQDAESCYLIQALLKFYLDTVFKNYHGKAAEFRILKSFSTLANNFIAITSRLRPSVSRTMLGLGPMGNSAF